MSEDQQGGKRGWGRVTEGRVAGEGWETRSLGFLGFDSKGHEEPQHGFEFFIVRGSL